MLRNISKQIQGSATIVPTNSPKHSRRAKKHQKWETLKTEAYRLYIKEDNTLQSTMLKIEEEFSFKARCATNLYIMRSLLYTQEVY